MLLSDGIDRHNKRTKLLKSTRGRVVEIRLHAGRSACRLLYVETATPGEIEIVRVVPTSAENPAAFNAGLEAALKAAEANLPGRGQAGAGLPADPE